MTAALRIIGHRVRERHGLTCAHLDALREAYGRGLVDETVAEIQVALLEDELRWLGGMAELLVGLFEEDELERCLAETDRRLQSVRDDLLP